MCPGFFFRSGQVFVSKTRTDAICSVIATSASFPTLNIIYAYLPTLTSPPSTSRELLVKPNCSCTYLRRAKKTMDPQ